MKKVLVMREAKLWFSITIMLTSGIPPHSYYGYLTIHSLEKWKIEECHASSTGEHRIYFCGEFDKHAFPSKNCPVPEIIDKHPSEPYQETNFAKVINLLTSKEYKERTFLESITLHGQDIPI
jgi:hypothetical protein